jgi:hypothetical protein
MKIKFLENGIESFLQSRPKSRLTECHNKWGRPDPQLTNQ